MEFTPPADEELLHATKGELWFHIRKPALRHSSRKEYAYRNFAPEVDKWQAKSNKIAPFKFRAAQIESFSRRRYGDAVVH
jgi:hypothetical protein